jgi:hypothetical protein
MSTVSLFSLEDRLFLSFLLTYLLGYCAALLLGYCGIYYHVFSDQTHRVWTSSQVYWSLETPNFNNFQRFR